MSLPQIIVMKKNCLNVLIFTIMTLTTSCRKDYTCYVTNDSGDVIDTIECNCYQSNIDDLEGSDYNNNGEEGKINCISD